MNKDFLQCLYEHLTNSQELTAVVGQNIFPLFIPQNEQIPALIYYPISTNYDTALQKDTGFVRTIIQFDCHDKTFKKARQLSRIVKKIFQNFSGDMNGIRVEATFIKSDLVINDSTNNKFDAKDTIHIIEFEFYFIENKEE